MVNHLLETRHPLSSSALSLCASAADPAFHSSPFFTSLHHYLLTSSFPYTLPSSVSRKSFVCHSYENTRGYGGILPILELVFNPFRTPHLPAFLAAVLRFQAAQRFCRANSYCPVFSFVPFPRKGMDKGPRCCLP